MTDQQPTPTDKADVDQDVEGHKIPRPGGTQGGFDGSEGPDGVKLTQSDDTMGLKVKVTDDDDVEGHRS